jgi:hypothetical protein
VKRTPVDQAGVDASTISLVPASTQAVATAWSSAAVWTVPFAVGEQSRQPGDPAPSQARQVGSGRVAAPTMVFPATTWRNGG